MALDTSKIIHAPVGGGRYTVTSPIVKEDYGLYLKIEGLELPSTYEVDFSNSEHNGTSVTMIGNADGVLIPRQFITTGKDVFAFLYHVGADFGRTVYKFRIPNKLRPDRTDEEPTPEQASTIDQAINALNEAVAQTAQDVIDADASERMALGYAEGAQESARQAQEYSTVAISNANSASQSASQASASATASAQSASEATQAKQDAQGYANEAKGYATQASNSADGAQGHANTAHGYATSASESAGTATSKATEASGYAQTASQKASEASTSASTASTKASEASTSASQALTYKTDAESAKTASQTAQGLAESARDSAISAQESAEDARDEAQSIVDGISGKVEQIDSNTERIESLEDDRYKPYVVDSASGSIASFSDGADDIPLKSLIVDIDPVQDLSNGDPSPENICPISGWTGANVWYSGKNLLDPTLLKDQAAWKIIKIYAPVGTKLTMSTDCDDVTAATGLMVYFRQPDGSMPTVYNVKATRPVTQTVGASGYVEVVERNPSGTVSFADFQWQIEIGQTPTSYEPYQGQIIQINWQTEAGTVYGGKLDVLSGVMRVDRVAKAFDGTQTITSANWRPLTNSVGWLFSLNETPNIKLVGNYDIPNLLADRLKTVCYAGNSGVYGLDDNCVSIVASGGVHGIAMRVKDTSLTTQTAVNTWLANNPVTVVYEITVPIEIQLDAHTLNSLYGQNNIFADTGDCSVEYRADTTLYISHLTEPDSDMIADANITSGKYFMVGNSLYKATANIASGSAVIVGTNAIRKSLSEALNEINS